MAQLGPRNGSPVIALDAGLFFISFQRDPHKQFAAIQRRLGLNDTLNEYIRHTGSAVFAVPPGTARGGYVGEDLFRKHS